MTVMTRTAARMLLPVLVAVGLLAGPAAAQRRNRGGGFFGRGDMPGYQYNVPYDGRYTFVRLRYDGYYKMQQEGPGWAHDYPIAETNFIKILEEITIMRPFMEGSNILDVKDPDLFKYPIAYLSEPGGWEPSEEDVKAFREYLMKGGFLIVDDFPADAYLNMASQMKRVLPKAEIVPIGFDHPIFDSFFRIESFGAMHGAYGEPQPLGIYEDNDPKKRLMAILNLNGDLGENWEFSDQGFWPIVSSNEAYKLGINYLMYALTR
jgi:hypothetical protein